MIFIKKKKYIDVFIYLYKFKFNSLLYLKIFKITIKKNFFNKNFIIWTLLNKIISLTVKLSIKKIN